METQQDSVIETARRKATLLGLAVSLADHLDTYGYGIASIDEHEVTVYSEQFQRNSDGYLDERAEAEVRTITANRPEVKRVFVDTIRPEGLICIRLQIPVSEGRHEVHYAADDDPFDAVSLRDEATLVVMRDAEEAIVTISVLRPDREGGFRHYKKGAMSKASFERLWELVYKHYWPSRRTTDRSLIVSTLV